MKIFFVRHGQTNYNVLGLCNDDPSEDVHLTDLGKSQAKELANRFKNIKFDLVITSEFPRSKETASIITKSHKFKIDPRINERKTGGFNNKTNSDFKKALEADILNSKFTDGESFEEIKKRVVSFIEELKTYTYSNILVVTHGQVLK